MEGLTVGQDKVVTLTYSLDIEGEEAPDWFKRPLQATFIFGREPVLPLIEQAISGAKENDEITVRVPPEQAYGPYQAHLVKEIPLERLKHPDKVKPGSYYEEVGPYGQKTFFKVLEVSDKKVKADFNHPAAGKNVLLKIRIEAVREATPQEILAAEIRRCGGG
ncbi:FKBP-type peptidyl-prolyl cis-trans isomerase [Thermosulfurimonas dismutans]|uniref:Peptidyl-prolyl cis-trans isomerase n=1 Tax=Thermosulfurimonas dismutans TaxID=999894 RepID=A0A179D6F3_9BACT|nr:FKBP-type peptidyl-prolyl cis-trans isomerase [Thermosulfurimonas dismutans]OAQ21674.1 FKBP-type peptidyl-prolyl cis-trans isomerase SlyD [Thermosulfurimonas dismutans]